MWIVMLAVPKSRPQMYQMTGILKTAKYLKQQFKQN
jgi:hypothetical protein